MLQPAPPAVPSTFVAGMVPPPPMMAPAVPPVMVPPPGQPQHLFGAQVSQFHLLPLLPNLLATAPVPPVAPLVHAEQPPPHMLQPVTLPIPPPPPPQTLPPMSSTKPAPNIPHMPVPTVPSPEMSHQAFEAMGDDFTLAIDALIQRRQVGNLLMMLRRFRSLMMQLVPLTNAIFRNFDGVVIETPVGATPSPAAAQQQDHQQQQQPQQHQPIQPLPVELPAQHTPKPPPVQIPSGSVGVQVRREEAFITPAKPRMSEMAPIPKRNPMMQSSERSAKKARVEDSTPGGSNAASTDLHGSAETAPVLAEEPVTSPGVEVRRSVSISPRGSGVNDDRSGRTAAPADGLGDDWD
jgi:hypothetical protein